MLGVVGGKTGALAAENMAQPCAIALHNACTREIRT